jgi:serine/threonine-protein kinase SRPK3
VSLVSTVVVAHCCCLLRAEETPTYHAIKILTVHATKGHHDGHLLELEAMQTITAMKTPLLPRLHDHFEIDGPHGRHLCFVLPVLSESVSTFRRSSPSKSLDTPKAKIIVAQVVEALVKLHAANIVHTGQ